MRSLIVAFLVLHSFTTGLARDETFNWRDVGCFSRSEVDDHDYVITHRTMWRQYARQCQHKFVRIIGEQTYKLSGDHQMGFSCFNDKLHTQLNDSLCSRCVDDETKYCAGDDTVYIYQIVEKDYANVYLATDFGIQYLNVTDLSEHVLLTVDQPKFKFSFDFSHNEVITVAGYALQRSYFISDTLHLEHEKDDTVSLPCNVEALGVDTTTNTFYFSCHNIFYTMYKLTVSILFVNDATITTFAVDPYRRLLMYADTNNTVTTYGLETKTHTHYRLPVSVNVVKLALDCSLGVLYMVESTHNRSLTLVKMDYEGTVSERVYRGPYLTDLVGLEVVNGDVFWINKRDDKYTLYRSRFTPGRVNLVDKIYDWSQRIYDFKVFSPEDQKLKVPEACCKLDCSHFCTAYPSVSGHRCTCPDGWQLSSDDRTCRDHANATVVRITCTASFISELGLEEAHFLHPLDLQNLPLYVYGVSISLIVLLSLSVLLTFVYIRFRHVPSSDFRYRYHKDYDQELIVENGSIDHQNVDLMSSYGRRQQFPNIVRSS